MMPSEKYTPPQWALHFFRWFCQPERREDLEGDLVEQYYHHVDQLGYPKAKMLFIKEIISLMRPGILRSFNPGIITADSPGKINRFKLLALNVLTAGIIISPFLPGPTLEFLRSFSMFGQAAGLLGLLLVPLSLAWIRAEYKNRNKLSISEFNRKYTYPLAIIALVWVSLIYLVFLLGVWGQEGIVSGTLCSLVGMWCFYQAFKAIYRIKNNSQLTRSPLPFYLLTIPLMAFSCRIWLLGPVSEFSRIRAISNGQVLITMVEQYHIKKGSYPNSLRELKTELGQTLPQPGITGISNFRYNKIGEQYSLSFSQWLHLGSLEEIVLYDKNDLKNNLTGSLAQYDYRFDLCRVKGAYASFDAGTDHWRYYLCD